MKTIAVVGGTGFLGKHVAGALKREGFEVRALSRRTGFDARHPDPELLRGVEAVVNLAGIKREQGDQTFQAVHVDLVSALVEAMKEARVRRLIHISVVVARSAPSLPYHDSKWKGEEIVKSSGLDYTILRPGVIYGEGDDMLTHLSLMIRTAPLFPIVGYGTSPMRPVDAHDVAAAVVKSLQFHSLGKTYDIVGPERLQLRDVVRRVAEALILPVWIVPTPVALMRIPVGIMEAVMTQPLSTRAQLAMLVEGLDGDPAPAQKDLSLSTMPFSTERIRPLIAKTRGPLETPTISFLVLLGFAVVAMAIALGVVTDHWIGMTTGMGLALLGSLRLPSVRRRLKPTPFRIGTGVIAGLFLFGITLPMTSLLFAIQPQWIAAAHELYGWRTGHSALLIALTLPMIVLAEEVLWRGVVARFLLERYGKLVGVVLAAGIYAGAHWAAFNPILLLAAVGCGIFWGLLYAATDDLVTPTVSHLVGDVLLLFVFPLV